MTDASPLVVIANPTSGRGKAGRSIGRVDRLLREAQVAHRIELSGSAADLEQRARSAAEAGAPIVAVLGGDGSVGLAANGLLGTGAALAILPSGTADDFAAAMGIGSLERAVRAISANVIEPIDVVRVEADKSPRIMVNVAGCGFDSEVNEAANAMRVKIGSTGTYVAAVLKTLPRFAPAGFTVHVDEQEVVGPHMLVVVANATRYGGGMRVAPDASVVDGLLDVVFLAAMSTPAFLRAFPSVFRGTHVRHPAVTVLRGRRVTVETDRHVLVYADGERVGPTPATFEVLPRALPIVVGPNPPAVR
jgi:diacylglycerol kinase (ATP)